jgi:hypothetical protein
MAQKAGDAKRKGSAGVPPRSAVKPTVTVRRSEFSEEEPLTLERSLPVSGQHVSRWEQVDDLLEAHPPPPRRSVPPPRGRISLWEEVHVDELIEVAEPPTPWSEPLPEARPLPTPGPVAFDVESPTQRSPMDTIPSVSKRSRRMKIGIAAAGLASMLGAAFLVARSPRWHATKPIAATMAPAPAPQPVAPPPAPVPPPESAPQAIAPAPPPKPASTTGLAIGSPGHRLFIDGRIAPSWKAEVPCGMHTFKFGAKGKPRNVDVPCGGEVTIVP